MKNIATILLSQNLHVLKPSVNIHCCNCRERDSSPLDNKGKIPQIKYHATVSNNFDNENKVKYSLT